MKNDRQNRLDLNKAILEMGKINVVRNRPSKLTITYDTGAILEAQKAWIASKLEKWLKGMEKGYGVRVVRVEFTGGWRSPYGLVIILELPNFINQNAVTDKEFREKIFGTMRKHFAERVIKEYPLPFAVREFNDIPIKPGVSCKFILAKRGDVIINVEDKERRIFESSEFQTAMKNAIEMNGCIFKGAYIFNISVSTEKTPVGYIELASNLEYKLDLYKDPLTAAMRKVMKQFFESFSPESLLFRPWGEKHL